MDCVRWLLFPPPLTCVIHVGSRVEGGGAAGLDLPPGAGVLGRPAAEGRIVGPAEVTGKPQESCKDNERKRRSDLISFNSPRENLQRALGLYATMT